jgi:hypothetical protein
VLITLGSVKGSPGVTSTALALAAAWPRPVVLVEADIAGGDLVYRCRSAHSGGPGGAPKGLLRLAAAVRGGAASPRAVVEESELLACGVQLVQGVATTAQARGMGSLWEQVGQACARSEVDVIADLGRIERGSAALPLVQAADHFLAVASTTLESVMHLAEGLHDILAGLSQNRLLMVHPVLVGADVYAARDCADLDNLLAKAGLPTQPARPMTYDPKALHRLEGGEHATGRLGHTLLLRAARAVGDSLVGAPQVVPG